MMPGRLAQLVDADAVAPGLYVGSRPTPGRYRWIHAIAFCAQEYQPPSPAFPGVTVLHFPMDDDPTRPLRRDETFAAISAGRTVARFLTAGRRVLVTCQQGWNRSGLVAAIAMQEAYGMEADEVIERVRHARGPYALSNPNFERLIDKVDATNAKRH